MGPEVARPLRRDPKQTGRVAVVERRVGLGRCGAVETSPDAGQQEAVGPERDDSAKASVPMPVAVPVAPHLEDLGLRAVGAADRADVEAVKAVKRRGRRAAVGVKVDPARPTPPVERSIVLKAVAQDVPRAARPPGRQPADPRLGPTVHCGVGAALVAPERHLEVEAVDRGVGVQPELPVSKVPPANRRVDQRPGGRSWRHYTVGPLVPGATRKRE
mmetsp:Transcript_24718/g.74251  ORF Transcript_24718/g.74251 Transcript_24718/m.74251 type:complete len:216 (-) Transcript_24718:1310-1957(-)